MKATAATQRHLTGERHAMVQRQIVRRGVRDELVDSGLVQTSAGDRYALHDLLHQYAASELSAHEALADRAALRSRTDEWLVSTAVAAARSLCPRIPTTTSPAPASSTAFESPEHAQAWLTDEAENWWPALERTVRQDQRDISGDLIDVARWSPPARGMPLGRAASRSATQSAPPHRLESPISAVLSVHRPTWHIEASRPTRGCSRPPASGP